MKEFISLCLPGQVDGRFGLVHHDEAGPRLFRKRFGLVVVVLIFVVGTFSSIGNSNLRQRFRERGKVKTSA